MSYQDFTLALKSTIDFQAKQLADAAGLPFLDLAASPLDQDIVESDQPAVCWEFATMAEMPQDPLWVAEFDVGAMTMLDPAQYISLDIIGQISEKFKQGTSIQIMDYSGAATPTQVLGSLYIVASGVSPQQSDRATGLRFVTVSARAVRVV